MRQGNAHQPELKRALGLLEATAIGLGAMIGSGIFVVIGVAAVFSGPALVLAMLVAAVPAVLNGLSAAACASALPQAGGAYSFGRVLLSPYAGFMAGWLLIFAEAMADAAATIGFAAYVTALLPFLPFEAMVLLLGLFVTVVNYFGISITSRVNVTLVALKIAALLFFVALGVGETAAENFFPFFPAGWQGVLQGAALLFFAYTGYARVATIAEEVRDPGTTIPRSVVLALAISCLLYLTTTAVAVGLLGGEALAGSASPLIDAVRVTSYAFAPLVITLGAIIATASVFLTGIAGVSRVAFAMARNDDLPAILSSIHSRHRTPWLAVLASGAGITLLAATVDLASLAGAASFALLVYYSITNLAAMRLQREVRGLPIAIPFAGVILCLGLILFLPAQAILSGLTIIGVGSLYYAIKKAAWLSLLTRLR